MRLTTFDRTGHQRYIKPSEASPQPDMPAPFLQPTLPATQPFFTRHRTSGFVVVLLALLLAGCQIEPVEAPDSPLAPDELSSVVAQEVAFTSGELTLAGTLTLPTGPGPHPALIFLTGSGPQDRNNASPQLLPDYAPYRQMAQVLAQKGIASLRYDDRGVGGSAGEMGVAISSELLADAEAALVYLQKQPEIDPQQIGVLGHSQGGIIAAKLAAEHPEIDFVIGLATPALSGYETVKDALARLPETTGLPAETVGPAAERELKSMDLALAQEWDELRVHLEETIQESVAQVPEAQREAFGDLDAFVETQTNRAMESYRSERYRDEMLLDPTPAWQQIEAPVLALYAEHETTVFAETHAPALAALLAGNDDVTIDIVPGVNHLFLEAEDGNLQQFIQNAAQDLLPEDAQDVPDRVLNRIADWVQARVNTTE